MENKILNKIINAVSTKTGQYYNNKTHRYARVRPKNKIDRIAWHYRAYFDNISVEDSYLIAKENEYLWENS